MINEGVEVVFDGEFFGLPSFGGDIAKEDFLGIFIFDDGFGDALDKQIGDNRGK